MPKKVIWTTKCDQAFLELKEALTRAPILMTPDWTLPFILQTDASSTGLGYVLSQDNSKGEENPIAFASKKLLPSERNYSAIEREALAIVKGMNKAFSHVFRKHYNYHPNRSESPNPPWKFKR